MTALKIIGGLLGFIPIFMLVMWLPGEIAQRRNAGTLAFLTLVAGMSGLILLVLGFSHVTR